MFAYGRRFFKAPLLAVALLAGLLAFSCGGESEPEATEPPAAEAPEQKGGGATGSEPDVADADAEDVEVITAWSEALSGGDVEGAAEFFANPSTAENGPVVVRIRSSKDAVAFNETLPCGAEVVSAETEGQFTTATFELLDRPGGACGQGVGGTAATSFVIEDGKITEWRRVGTGAEPDRSTGQNST